MNVVEIHPDYVNQTWHLVSEMLERSVAHCQGEYDLSQLRMMLVRREHVLLVSVDGELVTGAATVAFEDFPSSRVALVTSLGGKMVVNDDLYAQLRNWCRERGATKIHACCRDSVARLLKQKFNFKQRYVVVEDEL